MAGAGAVVALSFLTRPADEPLRHTAPQSHYCTDIRRDCWRRVEGNEHEETSEQAVQTGSRARKNSAKIVNVFSVQGRSSRS